MARVKEPADLDQIVRQIQAELRAQAGPATPQVPDVEQKLAAIRGERGHAPLAHFLGGMLLPPLVAIAIWLLVTLLA